MENDNTVVTSARDVSKAKDLLDLQTKYGKEKVKITELDVGSESSVKNKERSKENIGLDVVVNNAGIIGTKPGYKNGRGRHDQERLEVFQVNSVGPLIVRNSC